MQEVNQIAEECDWKTHFTAEECVDLVASVLEKTPSLIEYTDTPEERPKRPYQLAYIVDTEFAYKDCEYFMLGILDENGEFQDFYYGSGINYDTFRQWIPNEFSEADESCYEFSPSRHPGKSAKDILAKAGYVEVEERLDE